MFKYLGLGILVGIIIGFICPLNISLITDYDAGLVGDVPPVSHEAVIKVFNDNVLKLKSLLFEMIENIPSEATQCECAKSTNLDI